MSASEIFETLEAHELENAVLLALASACAQRRRTASHADRPTAAND